MGLLVMGVETLLRRLLFPRFKGLHSASEVPHREGVALSELLA